MELHNQATAHDKIVAAIVRSVLSYARGVLHYDAPALQHFVRLLLGKISADEIVGNELQKLGIDWVPFNKP